MQIRIRADASSRIGSGHVMRCLRLARAFGKQGAQVAFLCRPQAGDLCAYIREQGFEVLPIDAQNPCEDAAACRRYLVGGVDLLILDHYGLDLEWERSLRPLARRLLVIEDLPERVHDCDFLLDQNVLDEDARIYTGRVPVGCRMLLGPRFALLDESFLEVPENISDRSVLRRLLLFFGGGDMENHTAHVLREVEGFGLEMDIVIGASNPHHAMLEDLCRGVGARLHVQTREMARLMATADLMLGAGGSTHWERCRMGLPGIVMAVAENQEAVSCGLAERGACWYLGSSSHAEAGMWHRLVAALVEDPAPLLGVQASARKVVPDADGCCRVVSSVREVVA